MKPRPLSALSHFTVPVAIGSSPLFVMPRRDLAAPAASLPVRLGGDVRLPDSSGGGLLVREFWLSPGRGVLSGEGGEGTGRTSGDLSQVAGDWCPFAGGHHAVEFQERGDHRLRHA